MNIFQDKGSIDTYFFWSRTRSVGKVADSKSGVPGPDTTTTHRKRKICFLLGQATLRLGCLEKYPSYCPQV